MKSDIKSDNNESVVDLSQNNFNRLLNSDHVQLMKQRLESLKVRIVHLKKVHNRWNIFNNSVRVTLMTLSFLLTVANSVINVMPVSVGNNTIMRGITAGFSAVTTFTMVASEGTLIAYVKKMLNKYNNELNELQSKIDRSHLHYENSRSDGVITDEELSQFFSVIKGTNTDTKV